jgi:hypothetical protein
MRPDAGSMRMPAERKMLPDIVKTSPQVTEKLEFIDNDSVSGASGLVTSRL